MITLAGHLSGASAAFASENSNHSQAAAVVDTFHVSPQGSNLTGTGAKDKPWRSLTFALSQLASDSLKPKVIKLASGVYRAATTGESFPLNLKSWISIIGSDSINTKIDADKAARAVMGQNVAHILVTRLTIRNGFAQASSGEASLGGGLYLRDCRQIVVQSCVLRLNEAKTSGGGIFLSGGSNILIENNQIENNLAQDGAGIFCGRTKSAQILANVIQYNTAKNSAGAVYLDTATPVLQRNRIRWNNASTAITKNAGGIFVNAGEAVIGGAFDKGNDIHDNTGGAQGAQLYVANTAKPVNARYNYWGAVPDNSAITYPASLVDISNYRNLAINIPLGTTNFFVATNGSDQNNGSKNKPWRTLSFALTQIIASPLDSLTIQLASGIYSAVATGEKFPAYVKSNITLLGVVPGPSQSAETIISGEGVSSRELLRLEDVSEVRIAYLKFRNIKLDAQTGAILGRKSNEIIIENCTFENNQSQRGAAITFVDVRGAEIRHNSFRRNKSTEHGGALALLDDNSVVTNNIFTENTATKGGGAVHCDSSSEARFTHNEFQKNVAGFGGALYITRSNPRLSNNRILSNHANVSGGGAIALDGAAQPLIGTREQQSNDIYLNTAVGKGTQVHRLDPGLKIDTRYNFWGQIPDSTLLYPLAQFAVENYRQVSERMPVDTREIYVSPTGDDNATGISRSEALRTIGQAFRLSFGLANSPMTLRLLPGRFAAATNGETFPIALRSHLTVRGAGRDSTAIDTENRSRVFEGRDLAGSVITDLKIIGGKASGFGGAILISHGKTAAANKSVALTMTNCLLQNNSATNGGAVAAQRSYKTVIRNCEFANNTTQQGGGAVIALGDSVEISASEFYGNRAQTNGGAINVDSAAVATITGSRIHDNTAAAGGGIAVTNGLARIWRNFILDNAAQSGTGGGIYLSAGGKAVIGGSADNGNDLYGNRAGNFGKALGSAPRNGKIEARHNFFGSKPEVALVDNPTIFDVSTFRYVTITIPANSRQFYLSPKGDDANSGISSNSPWRTLVTAARKFFTEPGDSVRLYLQNGIYSANATGERFPCRVPNRVTLIGQHADSVVLDGGNKTRILEVYNVARVNLRNLTLTNGSYALALLAQSAGALQIHKSTQIRLEGVQFRRNATIGDGGAVAVDSSNTVIVNNCRFLENSGRGGGIFFQRSTGEIRQSEFRANRALKNGSAIYLDSASPRIISNVLAGNLTGATDIGGAIFCAGTSLPLIGGAAGQGNDIYSNTGGSKGKALAREGSVPVINATFNYLGVAKPGEVEAHPLNGFDLNFSRQVPIAANGKPIVTQATPPTGSPVRAGRQDTLDFKISAYDPDNDLLTYVWTLDDGPNPVGYGASYTFYPFYAGLGEHRVRVVVSDQRDTVSVNWRVTISTTSVTARQEKLPKTYALQQNFPNPLRSAEGMTVIPFQIPQSNEVVLEIYDLLGRRVRLLEKVAKPPGFYSVLWDGRDQHGRLVESGIYFVRMRAEKFVAMRKILVTR
jgi:predicted outer membrane repeat protein